MRAGALLMTLADAHQSPPTASPRSGLWRECLLSVYRSGLRKKLTGQAGVAGVGRVFWRLVSHGSVEEERVCRILKVARPRRTGYGLVS